eukprot:7385255-Prymnesium_polylepis.1
MAQNSVMKRPAARVGPGVGSHRPRERVGTAREQRQAAGWPQDGRRRAAGWPQDGRRMAAGGPQGLGRAKGCGTARRQLRQVVGTRGVGPLLGVALAREARQDVLVGVLRVLARAEEAEGHRHEQQAHAQQREAERGEQEKPQQHLARVAHVGEGRAEGGVEVPADVALQRHARAAHLVHRLLHRPRRRARVEVPPLGHRVERRRALVDDVRGEVGVGLARVGGE